MAEILNGVARNIQAASYQTDVGVQRLARHTYDFAVSGGAQTAFTIFTVTGTVWIRVFGVCQTLMNSAGAATIELGITGNTAILIAQTTATDLDQYETWQDATPEANPGDATVALAKNFIITNGADALMTVATADLNAGMIDFYAFWKPLSTNGNVAG